MTNQDKETLIQSLDNVFYTLDELGQLHHCLDALSITSENLGGMGFNEYWQENGEKPSYELSCRVSTQLWMIHGFYEQAKEALAIYEAKFRSRIEESQLLISSISPEGSRSNSSPPSTNSTLETCDNYIVDNSSLSDYYYY